MIKLESLSINKFRGIKALSIPFGGKSWVIQGRNGSGKSGVIDAIEFALSGSIGRLTGEGRGEVSVKEHGPHVDYRSNPKDAVISLQVKMNQENPVTVTRHCESPAKFEIEPKEQKEKWTAFGSEFVLSRREILKFVLTEPSERSKRVQTILKIEKLDKIRASLQTLKNKAGRNLETHTQAFTAAKTKLKECLNLKDLKKEDTLAAVNKHRTALGLNELTELGEKTRLTEGLKAEGTPAEYINKTELKSLYAGVKKCLTDDTHVFGTDAKSYIEQLAKLDGREAELEKLSRVVFYDSGIKLITSEECPFCETEWDQAELKEQIKQKVQELAEVKTIKRDIDLATGKLKAHWTLLKNDVASLIEKSKNVKEIDTTFLTTAKDALVALIDDKSVALDIYKNAITTATRFGLKYDAKIATTHMEGIEKAIDNIPEKSDKEKSQEALIICQERFENYYETAKTYEYHKNKSAIASALLEKFNEVAETYLNELYEGIQGDFSKFYQIVNADDEASFKGELVAANGALGFTVDFFGRGQFPPVAYHSEGHQDGMGLCLYLALMKKIMGDRFTLAILDDVLISVDSDHRKSFCMLLKQEFPNTQFIITTHDKVWQKQMITEGLISHSTTMNFKNWTVDTGPSVWNEKDSWEEIDEHIKKDNISEASLVLRRFLEYFIDAMSVRLSAAIPRSASGDHELGELLSGTTSKFGELLKKAKRSAKSWKNDELEKHLEKEKHEFDECLKKAQSETWVMNATVHFNSWATMGKPEFIKLRDAYFELIQKLKCDQCNTLLHVIPAKGASETMKCDCNKRNYNLKENS